MREKSVRFLNRSHICELQNPQPRTENTSERGTEPETEHELSTEKQKGELLSF